MPQRCERCVLLLDYGPKISNLVETKGVAPSTLCLQGTVAPTEHAPPNLVEPWGVAPQSQPCHGCVLLLDDGPDCLLSSYWCPRQGSSLHALMAAGFKPAAYTFRHAGESGSTGGTCTHNIPGLSRATLLLAYRATNFGSPGGIRTHNILLLRQAPLPIGLQDHFS